MTWLHLQHLFFFYGRCSRWKAITASPPGHHQAWLPLPSPRGSPWPRTQPETHVHPQSHQPLPQQCRSRAGLQLPSAWPCPAMGPAEPGLPTGWHLGLALACPQGGAGPVSQAVTLTHFLSTLRRAESLFPPHATGGKTLLALKSPCLEEVPVPLPLWVRALWAREHGWSFAGGLQNACNSAFYQHPWKHTAEGCLVLQPEVGKGAGKGECWLNKVTTGVTHHWNHCWAGSQNWAENRKATERSSRYVTSLQ